ncbi:MAG TPA: hypothetical protein VK641_14865 [Terriglobales bacterium]|nr:hypothetical protein [Terriglobales bacterium]
MPKKTANSTGLMTTIARGVGSAVGRIANTAQRFAAVSTEVVKGARAAGKKATRSKPVKSTRKKTRKRTVTPKAKTPKKSAPARA